MMEAPARPSPLAIALQYGLGGKEILPLSRVAPSAALFAAQGLRNDADLVGVFDRRDLDSRTRQDIAEAIATRDETEGGERVLSEAVAMSLSNEIRLGRIHPSPVIVEYLQSWFRDAVARGAYSADNDRELAKTAIATLAKQEAFLLTPERTAKALLARWPTTRDALRRTAAAAQTFAYYGEEGLLTIGAVKPLPLGMGI